MNQQYSSGDIQKMKDLNLATKDETDAFFGSFDHVLCDVDGVLWHRPQPIPGAIDSIKRLKNLKKKITFVSNRTTRTQEEIYRSLKDLGFDINQNDLIMPEVAIISHLKEIKFDKEIFLIGMTPLRSALEKSGFKVAESPPQPIEELTGTFIKMSLDQNKNVGAVITDIDTNTSYLKLQKAALYLQKPEILYITGNSTSKCLNGSENEKIFNSGYFDWILEDFTRKALRLAKPSTEYGRFIHKKIGIEDPSRVLFIGDSIEDDMAFASNCGYKKLLVLSGMTSRRKVTEWTFSDKYKPQYYADGLEVIADLLKSQ